MELLEKITLYDLLGYTMPGCVLIYILKWPQDFTTKKISSLNIVMFIVFGYLLGILVSEISNLLLKKWEVSNMAKTEVERKIKLEADVIKIALEKAKVLQNNSVAADMGLMWKYFRYMYMDIQADKTYTRIHNYASAEVLYKNMALVSAVYAVIYGINNNQCIKTLLIFAVTVVFLLRWWRFSKKKMVYTVYCYVNKYINK